MSQRGNIARRLLPTGVFVGLTVFEFVLLAFVDTTTQPLDRTGAPFLIQDIAAGTVITQRFEVGANGLDEIRLDGRITAGTTRVVMDARLLELGVDGNDIGVVRETRVDIPPDQTECCLIRFSRVPDARWRFFRVDLIVGDLNGRRLSLWAAPGPVNGRLTLNGRPQRAFLIFETSATGGTVLARLRSASPAKTGVLLALALLFNAGVAALMHLIPTASDPRRA